MSHPPSSQQSASWKAVQAAVAPDKIIRKTVNGILWIGDPHLTQVKPGRRTDQDFAGTVCGKITQAIDIARERGLYPFFLGDVFDNAIEPNPISLLIRLGRALDDEDTATIVGNHDKNEVKLRDNTLLAACRDFKLMRVIEHNGLCAVFEIDGVKVGVASVTYGDEIPQDARDWYPDDVEYRVLVTHENIGINDTYPGAKEPWEILGCDLVVNGHVHETKPVVKVGQTQWFIPGNITRLSVDVKNHVPSVWEWNPKTGIKQHVLKYDANVFDLTGLRVQGDTSHLEAQARQAPQNRDSVFASLLLAESASDMKRSASGDVVLEDIEQTLAEMNKPPEVSAVVRDLHRRAPERMKMK